MDLDEMERIAKLKAENDVKYKLSGNTVLKLIKVAKAAERIFVDYMLVGENAAKLVDALKELESE